MNPQFLRETLDCLALPDHTQLAPRVGVGPRGRWRDFEKYECLSCELDNYRLLFYLDDQGSPDPGLGVRIQSHDSGMWAWWTFMTFIRETRPELGDGWIYHVATQCRCGVSLPHFPASGCTHTHLANPTGTYLSPDNLLGAQDRRVGELVRLILYPSIKKP